nr:hypothetical protein [Deltaproteobacteria bacterium]
VQASHLITPNGRLVTIQNCGIIPLELAAVIPTPFAIDGTTVPAVLQPSEITRISVGFHPTQVGVYHDFLTIESKQLSTPLKVELSGEGVSGGGEGDADPEPRRDTKSFYGCGCRTADPGSAFVMGLALLGVLRRRRRHGCERVLIRIAERLREAIRTR